MESWEICCSHARSATGLGKRGRKERKLKTILLEICLYKLTLIMILTR